MRILMVIPSLGPGGAERVMSMLSHDFIQKGHSVQIVTVVGSASDDFYSVEGVERVPLDLGKESVNRIEALSNSLARIRALRRVIRQRKPDVVVSFLTETNILTYLASIGSGVPVVASEHTDPERCPLRLEWKILRALVYPRCARVVVPNRHIASRFSRRIRRMIEVLPNPVAPSARAPGDCVGEAKTVLTVGRMTREKNHRLLIDGFAMFSRENPDWDLVIIGDGPLKEETIRYAEGKGIAGRVQFPGLVKDPWSAFSRRAAMFVLSSDYEGLPMALCEAMNAGLPVISTRYHAGIEELIEDGSNGLIVPRGDAKALAEAMRYLADSSARRVSMGREARRITASYGLPHVSRLWLDTLKGAAEMKTEFE